MKSYYTIEDIKDIMNLIEQEEQKSKKLQEESTHKDFVSDSHAREVKRLKVLLQFIRTRQIISWYNEGCLLINNKFIFSTKTNKWRIVGKPMWYNSKSPKDFIDNYLKYDNIYYVRNNNE